MTTKELATTLGVSVARLNELGRKGKISREANGGWDLGKVRAALGQNLDTRQASPARGDADAPRNPRPAPVAPQQFAPQRAPEKGTLAHAQLMHEQARAARAALEAQRLEGKLIDRQLVQTEWTSVAASIRSAMLAVPSRVVNRVPAEWRRTLIPILEEEIRGGLTSASDEIRNDPKAA